MDWKQKRAQRKWDSLQTQKQRKDDKCQRCHQPRWAHNRGNRWWDDSICKRFLEPAESTHD
jgi:hypothetical protein